MHIFDENCPTYFAENERQDFSDFLASNPSQYKLGLSSEPKEEGRIISGFGLMFDQSKINSDDKRGRLSWILVSSNTQGLGIGSAMMEFVISAAMDESLIAIDIAASHLSAPFFVRFGANTLCETPNGWGEGMHKVDMEIILGY